MTANEIRKKRFEEEGIAKLFAAGINEDMDPGYCPLAQTQCHKDCVCWVPARVTEEIASPLQGENLGTGSRWKVQGWYCDNAMFSIVM